MDSERRQVEGTRPAQCEEFRVHHIGFRHREGEHTSRNVEIAAEIQHRAPAGGKDGSKSKDTVGHGYK